MSACILPNGLPAQHRLREIITRAYRIDEAECLTRLLPAAQLSPAAEKAIAEIAERLVTNVRSRRSARSSLELFLQEYTLSTPQGVALMCLAEAALRTPDIENFNRLITDKIGTANWQAHCGQSDSWLVNAGSWALMLTGKMLNPTQAVNHPLVARAKQISLPMIRKAVSVAMRKMGKHFVMGQTVAHALKRAKKIQQQGYTFSFDMLGEAARTPEEATRFFKAYQQAIAVIAHAEKGKNIYQSAGISIKLSALHPRYELAQQASCFPVLVERLTHLALQAKHAQIGLTVDAEEADRLELSLDIIAAVISNPALKDWHGFGIAVQAYQKRAFYVIDWLAELARKNNCKLAIRLVKGAYWDYEIKDAQMKGLTGYPVFTRKVNTDVSYLACAKKIIAYGELFFPQFATHNAYSVAAILVLMAERRDFEFQCLQGMGRALYDQINSASSFNIPCRIYAPVGQHQELLPYLVRRLLENGANSSFVNQIMDEKMPIKKLIAHASEVAAALENKSHPRIPLPKDLYGASRINSNGIDFSNRDCLNELSENMQQAFADSWHAKPTFQSPNAVAPQQRAVIDPSNQNSVIGTVTLATTTDLDLALNLAAKAAPAWDNLGVNARAQHLERLAELLEQQRPELMALLSREAGKTLPDALGEVREAIDFCRYYAVLARDTLKSITLPGPTGEFNQLSLHGRGVFLCISPWNFPLAIFLGQIVAALVAGNCVLAKPAEQTVLIAAKTVELMHAAGIPKEVIQLVCGKGAVIGAAGVADPRVSGVMFTGSTATAQGINKTLANRSGPLVPFIAETGGQNVLIADSTALPEQLVMDVMTSAFNSAGQRCSALRVLFLQNEMADHFIALLKGAMSQLKLGEPYWLETDIGPVIDKASQAMLMAHVEYLNTVGKLIYQVALPATTQNGHFFAPYAFEIPRLDLLEKEIFGPILHIIRYDIHELDQVIDSVKATGYALTLGIHSRINTTIDYIKNRIPVGNTYVNRNMIGAVVGVQPFGGEGLSGTGPKAGGPHYLTRLCHERSLTINTAAAGGNAALIALED